MIEDTEKNTKWVHFERGGRGAVLSCGGEEVVDEKTRSRAFSYCGRCRTTCSRKEVDIMKLEGANWANEKDLGRTTQCQH